VKTESEILRRLEKLHRRYLGQYIKKSQQRTHINCKYNIIHRSPTNKSTRVSGLKRHLPVIGREEDSVFLSPERQISDCHNYIDIESNELDSIRLCGHGIENNLIWNGDICDTDSISKSCKLFSPKVSVDEARDKFGELMSDDKYVYEHYRDIATLQWILKNRINNIFSLITIIYVWFLMLLIKLKKQTPEKEKPDNLELIVDDLWSEDDFDRNS